MIDYKVTWRWNNKYESETFIRHIDENEYPTKESQLIEVINDIKETFMLDDGTILTVEKLD